MHIAGSAVKAAAAAPQSDGHDPYSFERMALQPVISLALRYVAKQSLLPCRLAVADLWEGPPTGSE